MISYTLSKLAWQLGLFYGHRVEYCNIVGFNLLTTTTTTTGSTDFDILIFAAGPSKIGSGISQSTRKKE